MASLAAVPFRPFVCVELGIYRSNEVRRGSKMCKDFFVAGAARVRAYVESWIGRRNVYFGLIGGLGLLCGILFVFGMSRRKYQNG